MAGYNEVHARDLTALLTSADNSLVICAASRELARITHGAEKIIPWRHVCRFATTRYSVPSFFFPAPLNVISRSNFEEV